MRRLLRLLLPALLPALSVSAYAYDRVQFWAEQGNQTIEVVGVTSNPNTPTHASYPGATITVYLTGTAAKATLYSNNLTPPTALANPFTCQGANGLCYFYAADGAYDINISGGTPQQVPAPFTLGAVSAFDPTQLVNTYSVKSAPYNAKCDGVTDDSGAITNALNGFPAGSTVNVPPDCYVNGTITIAQSVNVQCTGAGATHFLVGSGITSSEDVIHVQAPSGGIQGLSIRDCGIEPASGTPARYGINLDATSGTISGFLISHVAIGLLGASAVATTFPSGANGVFNGQVTGSFLGNGAYMNNAGDTIAFRDDYVFGAYGYYVKQVSGAGAFLIDGGSIVSCGGGFDGQIQIDGALKPVIKHTELEPASSCSSSTPASGALINFAGSSGNVVFNPTTEDVKLNLTPSTTTYGIRDNYVEGAHHMHDAYGLGASGQHGVLVTSNAGDVTLDDPANYTYTLPLTDLLVDQGSQTMCRLNRFGVMYFGACLSSTTPTQTFLLGQPGQGATPYMQWGVNGSTPLAVNAVMACYVSGTCIYENTTPSTGSTLFQVEGGPGQSGAMFAVTNNGGPNQFYVDSVKTVFNGALYSGSDQGIDSATCSVYTNGICTAPGPPAAIDFASITTCNSAAEGMTYPVKDSTTNTWGATITSGGGSDHVLAYCDGTNWTVAAK